MTNLIGYLVGDRVDDLSVFQGWAWAEDFRPQGTFVTIDDYPDEEHSPDRRKEFTRSAMSVYNELRKRGLKDIMMAMTLYSDAFDDYELKYLNREANPASHDDWLALDKVYMENVLREKEYYEKHRTVKGRIVGFVKGKKYRTKAKVKGVLAVARIQSNLTLST